MKIITRTEYSADDGKTWGSDEKQAKRRAVTRRLRESTGASEVIMGLIEERPDVLIAALRDMGALPEESVLDAFAKVISDGSFSVDSTRYAVVPMEEYEMHKAAIERVKAFARGVTSISLARAWCHQHGIDWEDNQ